MPFGSSKPTRPIAGLLPEELRRAQAELARDASAAGVAEQTARRFLEVLRQVVRGAAAAGVVPGDVAEQLEQWLGGPEVRDRLEAAVAGGEADLGRFQVWIEGELAAHGLAAEAADRILAGLGPAVDAYIEALAAQGWPDAWQARMRRHPGDALWPYLAAHSYYSAGQLGAAIWALSEAATLGPDDPRPFYLLGVIFYGVYAELSDLAAAADAVRLLQPQPDAAFWQQMGLAPPGAGEVPAWQQDAAGRRAALASLKQPLSAGEARDRALQCFAAVLGFNLSREDRRTVDRHVSSIVGSGA
jgi:hypothetical protein